MQGRINKKEENVEKGKKFFKYKRRKSKNRKQSSYTLEI